MKAQTGTVLFPGTVELNLRSNRVTSCEKLKWHAQSGNLRRSNERIFSTDEYCRSCHKYSRAEAFDDIGWLYSRGGCRPQFSHRNGCRSSTCKKMPCVVCLLTLCCHSWIWMCCPCCGGERLDDIGSSRMSWWRHQSDGEIPYDGHLPQCQGEHLLCSDVYVLL